MRRYPKPIWYKHRNGYELLGDPEAAAEAIEREASHRQRVGNEARDAKKAQVQPHQKRRPLSR